MWYGIYNRDFNLDILFPEFMVKAKSAHVFNKKSMECSIWNQVKQKSGNIKTFIDSFKDMLNKLKNSRIAASDMLPLYCKVKNMKKSDKLLTWQRESLIDELYFVNKRIKFYTKIFD